MGRYVITSDKEDQLEKWVKAALLEKWVQELVKETNKSLDGAELYDADLLFIEDPVEKNGRKYYKGHIEMYVKFTHKTPHFLTKEDRELWYCKMNDVVKRGFGDIIHMSDIIVPIIFDYSAIIDFEEPSKEELYKLTPNKEATIRNGFNRIRKFVEWYCSTVKDCEKVIQAHKERMQQYLANLETISK